MQKPDTLVVGATGFIGRWLTAELLTRGRTVAATVRGGPAREAELRTWLRDHDVNEQALTIVQRRHHPRALPRTGWTPYGMSSTPPAPTASG